MSPYDTDECGVSLQGNRDPLEALSRLGESLVAEGDRLPLGDGDISADARDEQSPYSNALEFGLYNMKRPSCGVEIVHEKPEHRIILFLKAQGHSHTEIAKITGYTIPWISQIVRQPWARERLMRILTEQGEDAVQAVLRGEVLNSVFTLIEVRDTAANPAVRAGAANSILDRYLGKPMQRIEQEITHAQATTQVSELDRQIAELEAEEQRIVGATN